MSGFAPTDLQRGASCALMGFIKAVMNPLQLFIVKWDLDMLAQDVLLKLDADTQMRVIRDFHPKDISKGASVALMGFVKSILGSQPLANGGPEDPLTQFVTRWALDAKAQ